MEAVYRSHKQETIDAEQKQKTSFCKEGWILYIKKRNSKINKKTVKAMRCWAAILTQQMVCHTKPSGRVLLENVLIGIIQQKQTF